MPKNKIVTSSLKVSVSAKNLEQKEMLRTIAENHVTFVKGSPGSGKTYLSVGFGLQSLVRGDYEQIIFSRPVVKAGEKLGFLPGNMYEKIDPYMIPIFETLTKILPVNAHHLIPRNSNGNGNGLPIRILPFAYMRGLTFEKSFVVCDECFVDDTKISVVTDSGISHRVSLKTIMKNPHKYRVLSLNMDTGDIEHKSFTVFSTGKKPTCKIKVDLRDCPVVCSVSHPFAVIKNGEIKWKKARSLSPGDHLLRIKLGENNCSILHKSAWDILLGTLLGDGCLSANRSGQKSYRISKTHGLMQ